MPSQPADYQISVMSPNKLRMALDWARLEGWNPGLEDAAAFYAADSQGFLPHRRGTGFTAAQNLRHHQL